MQKGLFLVFCLVNSFIFSQNVGIGTATPLEKLHVVGTFRVDDLQTATPPTLSTDKLVWTDVNGKVYAFPAGAIGKVVGIDGTGILAWLDATTNEWHLDGNTNGVLKSIGPNDNFDFPFEVNGSEFMRITTNTKLGIGTTTPGTYLSSARVEIASNGGNNSDVVFRVAKATGNNPYSELMFQRSDGTIAAPLTLTQADRSVGNLSFAGYDGTSMIRLAQIYAVTDAIPGTNDMPGRLEFHTTQDGSSSLTQRMVIKNNGFIGIGAALPLEKLHIKGNITIDSTALTHGITVGKSQFVQGPNTSADNQYHNVVLSNNYAMTSLSIYSTTKLDGDMKINGTELKNVLNNATQGWYGLNAGVSAAGTGTNTVATSADYQEHNCHCPDNYVATGIEIRAFSFLDGEMKLRCTALKTGYITSETGQGVESVLSVPFYIGADNQSHISGCPAGSYVKGVRIRAEDYFDGQLRVFCTGIERQ